MVCGAVPERIMVTSSVVFGMWCGVIQKCCMVAGGVRVVRRDPEVNCCVAGGVGVRAERRWSGGGAE